MLNISIKNIKVHFRPQQLQNRAKRMTYRLLNKAGGYTRRVMKHSIKRASRPNQRSQPGQPPLHHNGRINFKETIFYVVDMRVPEVVIGAVLLGGTKANGQPVPGILEKGGSVIMERFGKKRSVNILKRPYAVPAFKKMVKKLLPELIRGGLMRE